MIINVDYNKKKTVHNSQKAFMFSSLKFNLKSYKNHFKIPQSAQLRHDN